MLGEIIENKHYTFERAFDSWEDAIRASCQRIRALLKQGVRIFTGEFWYQGEENYREKIKEANSFLREKIEKAIELL